MFVPASSVRDREIVQIERRALITSRHREYVSRVGGNHKDSVMPSFSPTSTSTSSTSAGAHRSGALGLLAVLICATAIGAVNLAALQMIEARLGSYAPAALVVGAFSLGNALGLIVQGRLIDRFSATRILYPASALFCVTLCTAVFWHSSYQVVYLGLFLVAGLSLPAVTGVVRAAVPSLYPKRLHLRLYSAIAVTFQAGMAFGPLAAVAFSPLRYSGYAFLVIAGLVAAATACIAGLPRPVQAAHQSLAPAQGQPLQPPPSPSARTSPALLTRGYVTVLLATMGFGISTGAITVGLPAVLDATSPGLVGAAFTALALGDLTAGVLYGSRNWSSSLQRHLLLSLVCAALAAALLAWLVSWPILAVVAMFLLGAMGTPAGIAMSALLDSTVPSSRLTVAYTSMIATNLVAVSLGSAAGGTVIDLATPTLALVVAPLALFCAALIVTARRRSLI